MSNPNYAKKVANFHSSPEWPYNGWMIMGKGSTNVNGQFEVRFKYHKDIIDQLVILATTRGTNFYSVMVDDVATFYDAGFCKVTFVVYDETFAAVNNALVMFQIYVPRDNDPFGVPTAGAGENPVEVKLDGTY